MAPRQRRSGQGYAWACWRRLHASVPSSMLAVVCLDITRGDSPTRRLAWLMELAHRAFNDSAAACGGDVFAHIGSLVLARIRALAGRACMRKSRVRHFPLQDGRPVRPRLVVNPGGRRQALGLLTATVQHKQFPRRRGRLPREANCVCLPALHVVTARLRGAASPPPPTGSQQGRTGAILNS